MSENKMRKEISLGFVAVLVFTGIMVSSMISHSAQIRERDRINAMRYQAEYDSIMAQALRDAEAERALKDSLRGTVTDATGTAMPGVVVSDSYSCTVTDSAGHYALHRNPKARFAITPCPIIARFPRTPPTTIRHVSTRPSTPTTPSMISRSQGSRTARRLTIA